LANPPLQSTTVQGAATVAAPVLFISDLHLDPAKPDNINLGLKFFASAKGASSLFIIGDLFEYWLGDDAADPKLEPVYAALLALSKAGTSIHLMHGNRDFLLGEQFASNIGATLHHEDHVLLEIGSQSFSLLHGDTLCTDDADYQALRVMVRNHQWQKEFLALSIDARIAQAQALRDKSRAAVAEKGASIMDVNDAAVMQHCQDYRSDFLIHGHTHRPQVHACDDASKTGKRVVLGDWRGDHAMIARFDGQELHFEKFG